MLNVQELERQWFRYKLKSYIPKIILFIVLITLSIFIIVFTFNSDISSNTSPTTSKLPDSLVSVQSISKKTTLPSTSIKSSQETILAEPVKNGITAQEQLILQPSLDFINSLKYMPEEPIQKLQAKKSVQKSIVTKITGLQVMEHKNIKPIIEKNLKPKAQELTSETTIKKEESPPNFTINIKQEESDIQEVIKRFHNNKKPALSLFVAKRFYALKRYNHAYNYALITNELNSEIEESWLIAAKSLSKLNQKEKAITLLTQFIDDSKSIRAIMLLEKIKSGTL